MKQFLCILLAFYCIGISAIPCRDACNSHEHDTLVSIEQVNNHHQEEHDLCSPFCYCACCSTVALVAQIVIFRFNETFSGSVDLTVPDNNLPDMCFAVWQPPKAG